MRCVLVGLLVAAHQSFILSPRRAKKSTPDRENNVSPAGPKSAVRLCCRWMEKNHLTSPTPSFITTRHPDNPDRQRVPIV